MKNFRFKCRWAVSVLFVSFQVFGYAPAPAPAPAPPAPVPAPAPSPTPTPSPGPVTATLTWDSGITNTIGFKVSYAQGNVAPPCAMGVDVGNVTTTTVPNLNPATTYTFAVCAVNKTGTMSAPITTTQETADN